MKTVEFWPGHSATIFVVQRFRPWHRWLNRALARGDRRREL